MAASGALLGFAAGMQNSSSAGSSASSGKGSKLGSASAGTATLLVVQQDK
jgi:hypothetical protein